MWIKREEIAALSAEVQRAIDGEAVEFRDNSEGALSILRNDLHTLVAQMRAERDAAEASRALFAEFMENVSHQLKTPVTSLMLMADVLEAAPPERQEEFLCNMRTSLSRMDWLVTALLKMARLDAGVVRFERQAVAAQALVADAMATLAVLLDVRGQTLQLADATALLHYDRRWTAEALTNLIKNACEASPEGSIITVRAGENPLYEWISVTDAGCGLSREEQATLFTRFASREKSTGFGIGLPLALAIARGQRGDVDVDGGGKGCGATFTLKFYK